MQIYKQFNEYANLFIIFFVLNYKKYQHPSFQTDTDIKTKNQK